MNSNLLLLAAVALCAVARPDFSTVPGFASSGTDTTRPLHFEHTSLSTNARSTSLTSLSFSADVQSHVRSADPELSIQSISCHSFYVDLVVDNTTAVSSWGDQFVLVASALWGCEEGVVIRNVTMVQWDGLTAHLFGTRASYNEVFENADIHLQIIKPKAARSSDYSWTPSSRLSWNHVTGASSATTSPLTLWALTCEVNCDSTSTALNDICRLCPEGVDLKSKIYCEDCWADAGVDVISLEIGFSLKTLIKIDFRVNASAQVDIGELGIKLSAAADYSDELNIISGTIYGYTFNVGTVPVTLGIVGSLSAVIDVQADATAKLALSYSKLVDFSFEMKTASEAIVASATQGNANYAPSVIAKATGNAAGSIGLKAKITASLANLVTADLWVMPKIAATVNFSYPAFSAISTIPNDAKCKQYHLLEYDSYFSLPIGADATVLTESWSATVNAINPIHIAQGCMWNLTSADPLQGFVLTFEKKISELINSTLSASVLETAIGNEIAAALKISSTEVIATVNLNATSIGVTFVSDSLSKAAELAERLFSQALFSDSALWNQVLLSRLQSGYQS